MNRHKYIRLTPLDRQELWQLYQTRCWKVSQLAERFRFDYSSLYAIEKESKHLSIELRQQLRAEKSLTVLDELYEWLTQTRVQTAHGDASAKALDYTLKRRPSLVRYAHRQPADRQQSNRKLNSPHSHRQ